MSFINSNLKNTYFALRHAHSIANEKHLILSYPENGLKNYGLSKKGEKQTLEKLKPAMLKEFKLTRKNTHTISSDFLRALETAEIFCKLNRLEPPVFDKRLRERYFGEFEKMSSLNYQKIWQKDYENENHHYKNVESMTDVGKRIQDIIKEYFDIKDKQSIETKRLTELKRVINLYCDLKGIDRVFGKEGYITRLPQQRFTYNMGQVKQILEPINKWNEILTINSAKFKKVIDSLPYDLKKQIDQTKTLKSEFKVISMSRKK